MFRFAAIQYLYAGLPLIPLLVVFYWLSFRWKRRALERFGNMDLIQKLMPTVSTRRQKVRAFLLVSAVSFFVLSLARPQIGTRLEEVKRQGVDIVVALDVSRSMLAEDISPNRLEKAKHEIGTFIDKLKGDRFGLVIFAGDAFIQCPLTLDYSAGRLFLEVVSPDMIPDPGTALGTAIETSLKAFDQKERKHKVLVCITDGEDHETKPLEMAKKAEEEGVVIYTVGLGSSKGVPIPIHDRFGNQTGYKKDSSGEVVLTRLDEITLEKIALQTGGKYYRASAGEVELERIYDEIAGMEKKELGSMQFSHYEDRFQYVLGIGIFLILLEVSITDRKKPRGEWRGRFT